MPIVLFQRVITVSSQISLLMQRCLDNDLGRSYSSAIREAFRPTAPTQAKAWEPDMSRIGRKQMDLGELRKALGCFVTGVTIVTTVDSAGSPRGFTANSFTSVSLDPPLVLVCIAKSAGSYATFCNAKSCAINILSEQQRHTSAKFASRQADKFSDVEWRRSKTGAPILEGSAAWLDCKAHQLIDAGDHTILVGEVVDFSYSSVVPLGYYSGSYVNFALERQALDSHAVVGGIFEHEGRILFVERDGVLRLPTGGSLGRDRVEPDSLLSELDKSDMEATVSFIYSIFHDAQTGRVRLFYRGEITNDISQNVGGWQLHDADTLPWSRLHDPSIEAMLRRYFNEQKEDAFGIYVGNSFEGVVRALGPGQISSRL